MRHPLVALGLVIVAGPAPADPAGMSTPPSLSLPIRCTMGRTCWIQKYADVADGPDRRDYRCGTLTTDGHDGIDFRLSSRAQLRAGVAIVAAAPGVVLRVRDGEPDDAVGAASMGSGKEAGNAVVIGHGDGWETQYSHLMKGSIRVRAGDRVAKGAVVGAVGLSGNTEYPHVHLSVRHGADKIDPFTGQKLPGRCGDRAARPLWNAGALPVVAYSSGQIVRVAFADAPQNRATLQRGDPRPPGRHDAMLIMAELIGVSAGDLHRFEIRGPDGRMLLTQTMTVDRPNVAWVGYAGKKPGAAGWAPGRYTGLFVASRKDMPDRRESVTLDLR